jgi:hypothetical protein
MPRDWVEDCDMGCEVSRSHSRSRYMRTKDKGVHGPAICVGATQIAQAQHEGRSFNVVLHTAAETKCRTE